ncbi:MAG: winged helix-turn-helix domain-containing protein [Nanoarchaeota archaeon]|nr:winged helix-turn-helix domain-containing protein [Nanoarchaeota archaeon]
MVRKTKKQLVQRLIQLLESKPMTVNEISLAVGSNWDTVYKALDLLKSIGLVTETEEGNKKIFKKVSDVSIQKRDDTLLGIPISKECENLCYYLFSKVKQKWLQKTKKEPNKTQMQKVIGEIADNINLPFEIPRGWYLFGQVCVLEYDPKQDYSMEFKKEIPGLDKTIDKAIEVYSKYSNTTEILFGQYQRKNKVLYLARLKLKQILYYSLNQETKPLVSKLLNSFAMNFSKKEDNKEIVALLNSYVAIVNQLFIEKDQRELEDLHNLIIDCFISLWELMATYNLFNDLINGDYGYSYDNLKKYFNPRFETLIALCKGYLEELNDSLSPKEIDKNSKLFKLMGSAKPKVLTEEEKKKLFENYEKRDTSNIFREKNNQKFIFLRRNIQHPDQYKPRLYGHL